MFALGAAAPIPPIGTWESNSNNKDRKSEEKKSENLKILFKKSKMLLKIQFFC